MRVEPGLSFFLVCDLGFAVGLTTHRAPVGDLIWVAEPTFDEEPDIEVVQAIRAWRWPTFFPLGAAVRRKIVSPIGKIDTPAELRDIPRMRAGAKKLGWREVEVQRDGSVRHVGSAYDPLHPIYETVNDTMLKKMIVSGWSPRDDW